MRKDLGVAVGSERVPVSHELAPKLDVVVELPVLDRPDRVTLVRDGLVSAVDVDDAQAPHAERDAVPTYVPRSLGPRCDIVSVIQSSTAGSITCRGSPVTWITPQIPHIALVAGEPAAGTVDREFPETATGGRPNGGGSRPIERAESSARRVSALPRGVAVATDVRSPDQMAEAERRHVRRPVNRTEVLARELQSGVRSLRLQLRVDAGLLGMVEDGHDRQMPHVPPGINLIRWQRSVSSE